MRVLLCVLPFAAPARADEPAASTPMAGKMLDLLSAELQYSMDKLVAPDGSRPYYLAYTVTDRKSIGIQARLGALENDQAAHQRHLDVDARVGDYVVDNTHKLRGGGAGLDLSDLVSSSVAMSLDDDPDAIRHALWLATDGVFKSAVKKYQRVLTDLKTKVAEEDKSGDFTREQPSKCTEPEVVLRLDRAQWAQTLRHASKIAREYPLIHSSGVTLSAGAENRYLVTSEGTRLQTGRKLIRVQVSAESKAEDGMELSQSFIFDAATEDRLPGEQQIADALRKVIEQVLALRKAPLVEPYIGPAILMNRASGVFFHEIFGHRIEGHRQKDVQEGQTFAKKIGEAILPEFISVHDNPTLAAFGGQNLRGYYKYDDEGVASSDVALVENGVLKTFLMSRSPLDRFPQSNGHGRREPGRTVVSRQGNLIITSSKTVSFDGLRRQLVEECRKQDKPYGLLFDDITGGFTGTRRGGAQSFKVLPVVVYRVYADGRPDELVRGVDIVGTPLTCFSKIVGAADDPAVFNGICGAESGRVPVSAVSPSVLVAQIEVEKRQREQDKPPILPSPIAETGPDHPPAEDEALLRAMADELRRAMNLQVEDLEKPYFIQFDVDDNTTCQLSAAYGAITGQARNRSRVFRSRVRVGEMELDNTNFAGGSGGGVQAELPTDDNYLAIRHAIWRATDGDYKSAVETLTQKRAYMKDKNIADRPDDFSPAAPVEKIEPPAEFRFDEARWTENLKCISGHLKKYTQVQDSAVRLGVGSQNSYLVNSEGTRLRIADTGAMLAIGVSVQAEDGMRLSDSRSYHGDLADDLPAVDRILADLDAMVAELTAMMQASILDRYSGPVLFDGVAAPQLFRTLLANRLAGRPDPIGDQRRGPGGAESLETKLGTRILPKSFQVWDDPSAKKHGDTLLQGNCRYDDEGVPAAHVALVTDGRLETLCMSRAPTKKLCGTNGHARRVGGGSPQATVCCLFIEDKAGVSADKLKAELIEAAQDAGLEYGVRVKSLRARDGSASRADMLATMTRMRRGGGSLSDPIVAYRVYVADGREEPFRGCEFGTADVTMLKRIVAAGDAPYVHNYPGGGLSGGASGTLIAPPVLLEELELSRIDQEHDKLPILKAPLAR